MDRETQSDCGPRTCCAHLDAHFLRVSKLASCVKHHPANSFAGAFHRAIESRSRNREPCAMQRQTWKDPPPRTTPRKPALGPHKSLGDPPSPITLQWIVRQLRRPAPVEHPLRSSLAPKPLPGSEAYCNTSQIIITLPQATRAGNSSEALFSPAAAVEQQIECYMAGRPSATVEKRLKLLKSQSGTASVTAAQSHPGPSARSQKTAWPAPRAANP